MCKLVPIFVERNTKLAGVCDSEKFTTNFQVILKDLCSSNNFHVKAHGVILGTYWEPLVFGPALAMLFDNHTKHTTSKVFSSRTSQSQLGFTKDQKLAKPYVQTHTTHTRARTHARPHARARTHTHTRCCVNRQVSIRSLTLSVVWSVRQPDLLGDR